jgi:hypothetical protein
MPSPLTDHPSKFTSPPGGQQPGRHALLANESRIRCRHRYTPVVYLQLYALRIPVFADIDHIRHFLLLLQGVTACRIACE